MNSNLFAVPEQSMPLSAALLALRVLAGCAFVIHGWPKLQHPLSWMGPSSSTPGVLQGLAAVAEFFGGLGWMVGALTPLASFGIASTMVVAVVRHAVLKGDPFVAQEGPSWELAALYLCVALVLIAAGPGRYSLDAAVQLRTMNGRHS